MATCALRFVTIASVALALALAAPAARAEEPLPAGVDLTAMNGSVLMLSVNQLLADGSLPFPNEMAASSWNFLMVLLAGTDDFDPDDPYALYDPSDPSTVGSEGKCSFVQPQYCSSVQAFFDIQPAEPEFVTTLAAIRGNDRRGGPAALASRRIPGRAATPDPSAPAETTRTVDPQAWLVQIPGSRSPVLPDGENPVAIPETSDRNDVRPGRYTGFGRYEFVWHQDTPQGCLPPRRGLSALSGREQTRVSAATPTRSQRRGRCPPR